MQQRHGRIIRQGNENKKVDIYRYTTDKTFDAYLYQMLENKQKFISQIMTEKSPVRSCEDVDEAVLDYAEVKALCAGSPLIKEKIDLETEITKLNLIKSSFLSQKYSMQNRVHDILPQKISKTKMLIERYKADQETAEKVQPVIDDEGKKIYPVTVGDKTYTDKEDAGSAIRQAILKNPDVIEGKECCIGSYRGLEMLVYLDTTNSKFVVNLKGEANHYGELNMDTKVKASGNIIRLDNIIGNIGTNIMKENEHLQSLKSDLEEAKKAADAPFPQDQELTDKIKRLEEVNTLLSAGPVMGDRGQELYAALVEICPELQYSDDLYCRYEVGNESGIEPLTVERHGDTVFIAHTYEQNGDLMYDPAIEFSLNDKNKTAEALSYEQSDMGIYQEFRDGKLPEDKADAENMFIEVMAENIKAYGYERTLSEDGHEAEQEENTRVSTAR